MTIAPKRSKGKSIPASSSTSDRIYLSKPDITSVEEQAILRAVRSGWIAPLGPEVDAFEADLARINDREHCVALSSGTAALHLSLLGLHVKPGDVVVTSTMTFAATVNAITYTGAQPVLVDCDDTGCMSLGLLGDALADLQARGQRAAVILPVDLLGKVADHEGISLLAERYGARVASDAAESLGARRHGRPAGAFGHVAALSFNGNKVITSSGGGALVTDDEKLADRARYLATQARMPVVHYEHRDVGYNYRLSNLLAALGRAQLSRLPAMIGRRREMRRMYMDVFSNAPGVSVFGGNGEDPSADMSDNFWLTSILVDEGKAGWSRDDLMAHLAADNIEARPLWKPMHTQPVFANLPAYLDGTSDRLFETGLSLPSGSSLDTDERQRILSSVHSFLDARA